MKETKLPYHMTILDNKTGEVVHAANFYAIVGAIAVEGGATSRFGIADCDSFTFAGAVIGAQKAIDDILATSAPVSDIYALHAAGFDDDTDEK